MLILLTAAVVAILLYLLYYWLFVVTEGVFLGRRLVVWLYDETAEAYEGIKQYSLEEELILLVEPVLGEYEAIQQRGRVPLLVDVATGTGRVPFYLSLDGRWQGVYHGRVLALDPSARMLAVAQRQLASLKLPAPDSPLLVQQYAERLPLPTAVADIVTCLEALEFMGNQAEALAEMVRILRPGGLLFVTRRHGREAPLFLHRYHTATQLQQQLQQLGLSDIQEISWETDYQLLIAHKPTTR
jgi:ubiquinone/menaquinone biosynthesis C-methylase UbiE